MAAGPASTGTHLFFCEATDCLSFVLQLVEQASKKFVCIVDESKLVEGLGGSKGQSGGTACMTSDLGIKLCQDDMSERKYCAQYAGLHN